MGMSVAFEMTNRGTIIFITSVHKWFVSSWPSYCAGKGALGMIVNELAGDLAPNGIRVNGIASQWIAEYEMGSPFLPAIGCFAGPPYIPTSLGALLYIWLAATFLGIQLAQCR